MKFNLALNDVEKLLQDYYQKTIDSKAKIQIDVRKKQYGICDSDWMADPCVTLSLEGKVSGIPVTMTEDVTESVPDYLAELPTSELLQMLNTATKGEADGADKSQDKNQGEIETVSPDSVVEGTDTEND